MLMVESMIELSREAMLTALIVAAPALAVALLVGIFAGVLQTVTQIQDPTIALVPKIVAVFLAVAVCLPWLIERLMSYSALVFSSSSLVGGGS